MEGTLKYGKLCSLCQHNMSVEQKIDPLALVYQPTEFDVCMLELNEIHRG